MWSGYSRARLRSRTKPAAYPSVDHNRGVGQRCLPKHHEGFPCDNLSSAAHEAYLIGAMACLACWQTAPRHAGLQLDRVVSHPRSSASQSLGAITAGQSAVVVSVYGIASACRDEARGEGERIEGHSSLSEAVDTEQGAQDYREYPSWGNVEIIEPRRRREMRLATRSHDSSMRQLPDIEIRPGGLKDDGDPVQSRRQADVSQMGNTPSVTQSQAAVQRVAPWQAREVMYRILDRLCELYLSNGPAALFFVDHGGLLQLNEGKTHGLSVGHAFHLPHQLVVKPSLSGEGTVGHPWVQGPAD
jgi:hypothetical protein